MLRVSDETREEVLRLGREEFGGASADETIRRLIEEHWKSRALAAVYHYRQTDPEGWSEYLADAEDLSRADAAIAE